MSNTLIIAEKPSMTKAKLPTLWVYHATKIIMKMAG